MNPDERLTDNDGVTPVPNRKTIGDLCIKMPFCEDYDLCEECPFGKMIDHLCAYEDTDLTPEEILRLKDGAAPKVETSVFDKETTIENCTVQILENTVTGEVPVGWRKNEAPLQHGDLIDRDALIESFRTSGQFDISELGAIIPIIKDQMIVAIKMEVDDECTVKGMDV